MLSTVIMISIYQAPLFTCTGQCMQSLVEHMMHGDKLLVVGMIQGDGAEGTTLWHGGYEM